MYTLNHVPPVHSDMYGNFFYNTECLGDSYTHSTDIYRKSNEYKPYIRCCESCS